MTNLATGRPKSRLMPATFAFALLCLAGSAAQARAGGGIRAYFQNFYGQDFYDGQRTGPIARFGTHLQYDGGYYGPAMIYGRQYGDEYGSVRDRPFVPSRFGGLKSTGGPAIPR